MEGSTGGVKGYWKTMQYQRLDSGGGRRWARRPNRRRLELTTGGPHGDSTGSSRRRGRFWRIKVAPRLGFLRRAVSPRRLLTRVRDAYVRMMMSFASSRVFSSGGFGGDIAGFARPAIKEYDEKMLVEIYRSLMAQGHLAAAAAAAAAAKDGRGQAALAVPRRG